jgi:hypothetical protein
VGVSWLPEVGNAANGTPWALVGIVAFTLEV